MKWQRGIALVTAAAVCVTVLAPALLRPRPARAEVVTITVGSIALVAAAATAASYYYSSSPSFRAACDEMGISAQQGYRVWLVQQAAGLTVLRTTNPALARAWGSGGWASHGSGGPDQDPGWRKFKAFVEGCRQRGTLAAIGAISITSQAGLWLVGLAGLWAMLGVSVPHGLGTGTGAGWAALDPIIGKPTPATVADPTIINDSDPAVRARVVQAWAFVRDIMCGNLGEWPGVQAVKASPWNNNGGPALTSNGNSTAGISACSLEVTLTSGQHVVFGFVPALSGSRVGTLPPTWAVANQLAYAGGGGNFGSVVQAYEYWYTAMRYGNGATNIGATASDSADWPESAALGSPAAGSADPASSAYAHWQSEAPTGAIVAMPAGMPVTDPETTVTPYIGGGTTIIKPGYDTLQAWLIHAQEGIASLPAPFDSVIAWLVQPLIAYGNATLTGLSWLAGVWDLIASMPQLVWSFFTDILNQILDAIRALPAQIAGLMPGVQGLEELLTYIGLPTQPQIDAERAAVQADLESVMSTAGSHWPFAVGPALAIMSSGLQVGSVNLGTQWELYLWRNPDIHATVRLSDMTERIVPWRWLLVAFVYGSLCFLLLRILRPQVTA